MSDDMELSEMLAEASDDLLEDGQEVTTCHLGIWTMYARRLEAEIARLTRALDAQARRMVPEDETPEEIIARQQADPSKGGLAAIMGKWPGDETDEEVEAALAALEGDAMVAKATALLEAEVERLEAALALHRDALRDMVLAHYSAADIRRAGDRDTSAGLECLVDQQLRETAATNRTAPFEPPPAP